MTTHSNTLTWEIPWTEGPGGLQFMGSQRVSTTQGNRAGWETSLNLCSILNCSSALTRQQYNINGCFHNTMAGLSKCQKFYGLLLLLLLLSCFSHVRLCVTPQTSAHQAPPSLGFSRQEHWSGVPFSSPMHESESRSVMSDS